MNANEPIDRTALDRLLELIGGDVEDLQDLIEEFEQSTPDLVDTMRTAVAETDMTSLRIAAHSLKSNARDMGATNLAALCEALENAARSGAVEAPGAQVAQIHNELTRARSALAAMSLSKGYRRFSR